MQELCCFSVKIRDKVFSEDKGGSLLEKATDFLVSVVKTCQMKKRQSLIILEKEQEDSVFMGLSCVSLFSERNRTFCVASDSQPPLYKRVLHVQR